MIYVYHLISSTSHCIISFYQHSFPRSRRKWYKNVKKTVDLPWYKTIRYYAYAIIEACEDYIDTYSVDKAIILTIRVV